MPELSGSRGFLGVGGGGARVLDSWDAWGLDVVQTLGVFLRVFTVSHFDAMMMESRRDFCPSADGGVGSVIERKKEYL
jgi:hypothetical protein